VQLRIERVEYDVAIPPPFLETELVLSTLLLMLTVVAFGAEILVPLA
jgi:hypothetical protein